MKRRIRLALLSLATAAAWVGLEVAKTPRPSDEDMDYDQGLATQEWDFVTEDGAVLRGKRYINEGAQPIILAHGFSGNGNEFDLPRHDHNLAVHLAHHGYDVWISSFRGNGRKPNVSKSVGWKHSMDHLAAYDAPALIDGVTERTGKEPVWIGHSMGGMVLYMYLQGATFDVGKDGEVFAADLELARERNKKLAAGVAIGSPPALYWERGGFFGALSNSRIYRAVLRGLLAYLRRSHGKRPRVPLGIPVSRLAWSNPRIAARIAVSPAGLLLYNWKNIEPDVAVSLLRWGGDDVSARMAHQLISAVLDYNVSSYDGVHDYTENMDRITAPFFFVTGTEDFANSETIRKFGYDRISSPDKEFINFPGYGHTDLVMGKRVSERVYPAITSWLRGVVKDKNC